MSSLSNGLPRQTEDSTTKAFKEAALSLTNLYKAAQASRREGYRDAIDDIYSLFIKDKPDGIDVARLTTWIDERRRKLPTTTTTTTEPNRNETEIHLDEEDLNTSIMMISPSPISRSRSEGRDRRERERKRRGGGDIVTDLHKRGRYDRA